ncbi:MAG TPA: hypothetical protein VHB25_18475, partial [Gemmatimonadaceae bacterium]|nr:hypothetical protein [Gemmatimonadaceae bacterium]
MIRARSLRIAALLCAAAAPTLAAQSLESRVHAAPDGRVAFSFAARPGVCGDGRTYIQTGPNSFNGVYVGDGSGMPPCVPGPVHVVIDRADKLPLSVRAYVGPVDSSARGVTDLGRVRAQDGVDYLLTLAQKADGRAGRDAIFPATLADSANTAPALIAIARNTALPRETREAALGSMV